MTEFANGDQVRVALAVNKASPSGRTRSARAEELVAAAEALGDHSLLVATLEHLIHAYGHGGEQAKVPVPFARLLRLLDEHPEAFSPRELYLARWDFKWIMTYLAELPETPLPAITGWLSEMERRYRVAGFSMRTVAAYEMELALFLGDAPRARQARERMLSQPRDQMSDCTLCEAFLLGRVDLMAGRDAEALEAWSCVLSPARSCNREPQATLAVSLLPLLRLARTGEAAANHLRGYHLIRGNPEYGGAIGEHAEFCALSGNEARGVEILAENRALLSTVTDPWPRLQFLTGVAVLLRRLEAAGHGGIPVHSGRAGDLLATVSPEITELAGRFDARNGTSCVSDQVNQRLERSPLLDQLPLGAGPGPVAWRRGEQPGDGSSG